MRDKIIAAGVKRLPDVHDEARPTMTAAPVPQPVLDAALRLLTDAGVISDWFFRQPQSAGEKAWSLGEIAGEVVKLAVRQNIARECIE